MRSKKMMSGRLAFAGVAVCVAMVLEGCGTNAVSTASGAAAQASVDQSTGAREAALVRAHADWIAAINAGDHSRGLGMMTDDAAIIGPAGPVSRGKEEVRSTVAQLTKIPGLHIDFSLTTASVALDGMSGFVVGDSKIALPAPDGTLSVSTQRLVTVWRRGDVGQWRCYVEIVMPSAKL
jgi:ketosteroid isomerase-like protein